jgi:hypothetical protein
MTVITAAKLFKAASTLVLFFEIWARIEVGLIEMKR